MVNASALLKTVGRVGVLSLLVVVTPVWTATSSLAQGESCPRALPAFPGAEGFGKFSRGGRGGEPVFVTNLNDHGPGSLREAMTRPMSGPRTVLFRVSGSIVLASELRGKSFTTIAGESAPGDGIEIRGHDLSFTDCEHLIIRDIAIRRGNWYSDPISFMNCRNVIMDSCSVSFASDENISFKDCDLITVQWSITSFGLRSCGLECRPADGQSTDHSCAMLLWNRTPNVNSRHSILHNLFSECSRRVPLVQNTGSGSIQAEIIGNVVYNWGVRSDAPPHDNGNEAGVSLVMGDADGSGPQARILTHLERNLFKYGPNSTQSQAVVRLHDVRRGPLRDITAVRLFRSGNRFQALGSLFSDVSCGDCIDSTPSGFQLSSSRLFTPAYTTADGIGDITVAVVERAGAGGDLLSRGRDTLDGLAMQNFVLRIGGHIDHEWDVFDDVNQDGVVNFLDWPIYRPGVAEPDLDDDGMPDSWERARGSDPSIADGHLPVRPGNYTRLEEYLHGLRVQRHAPLTVCLPDFNCDDFVDFFDYSDFVDAFEAGDSRSDFNQDGFVDFFDYSEFVMAFEIGC